MILRGVLVNIFFATLVVLLPSGLYRGLALLAWLPVFLLALTKGRK